MITMQFAGLRFLFRDIGVGCQIEDLDITLREIGCEDQTVESRWGVIHQGETLFEFIDHFDLCYLDDRDARWKQFTQHFTRPL